MMPRELGKGANLRAGSNDGVATTAGVEWVQQGRWCHSVERGKYAEERIDDKCGLEREPAQSNQC